ncbi:MAG: cytochrome c-type biogenesis protein CcmH [Gammaproteobacteria bacterium]|nr:cytochrome c-type biogenesis protein CcmH [Gammaproteobacteria bacterium]
MHRLMVAGLLALMMSIPAMAEDAALPGPVKAEDAVQEDPMHREMLDIAKDLRCAVCQNQPVSESNSELARDMRVIIREQLEQGKSRSDIVQYFVERYGNFVLMKAPYSGTGTVLWLLPAILVVLAVLAAAVYLRSRLGSGSGARDTADTTDAATAVSEEDRERIRALREKGGV